MRDQERKGERDTESAGAGEQGQDNHNNQRNQAAMRKIVLARRHNSQHADLVAQFRAATGDACVISDQLSIREVIRWQYEHGLKTDGKITEAVIAAARGGGKVDESVKELFREHPQSTDQERGTDPKQLREQADACRLALEKHLGDFKVAALAGVEIAMRSVEQKKSRVKPGPVTFGIVGSITKFAVEKLWEHCGGAGFIKGVVGIAKEELLGSMAEHAEKAYEFAKSGAEKLGGEASLTQIAQVMQRAANANTEAFVDRGTRAIASADPAALARTWRLVAGTADHTAEGEVDRAVVRTDVMEKLTGIEVGGGAAMRIANTVLQEALVRLATVTVGNEERQEAIGEALSGEAGEQNKQSATELGYDSWIKGDEEKRARVLK